MDDTSTAGPQPEPPDPSVPRPLAEHTGAPLISRTGEVWRIVLNRPEQHNRLDPADVTALLALFEDEVPAAAPRALVITGAGHTTFSSGYTLEAISTELDSRFERMLDALEHLPCVTIAALNGSVYGGATDLALCCDVRLGQPGMRMFMPAARFGLHYYPGGLRRYVSRLGLPAATRLMLTAITVDHDELLRIGFLSERTEANMLDDAVERHLQAVLRTEPLVVAQMKRHLQALAAPHDPAELEARMRAAYEQSLGSAELKRRLDALMSNDE